MFLMDTDILSALRRRDRHPDAVRWLDAQRTVDLHLSVVTIGEVERGHHPATPTQPDIRRRTGPLAGPGAGLVRGQDPCL